MGTSTDAHCFACGHDANIMIGGGRSNYRTFAAWPVSCSSCRAVTAANALASPLACLDCGSEDVAVFEEAAGGADDDREWCRLRGIESAQGKASRAANALKAIAQALGMTHPAKLEPAVSWDDLALSRGRFVCPCCAAPQLRFGTRFAGSMPIMWD